MVPLHEDDGSWMIVSQVRIWYGDDGDDILNLGWNAEIIWSGVPQQRTKIFTMPTRQELYATIEQHIGAKLCAVVPSAAH
jgi:hypothetical protein